MEIAKKSYSFFNAFEEIINDFLYEINKNNNYNKIKEEKDKIKINKFKIIGKKKELFEQLKYKVKDLIKENKIPLKFKIVKIKKDYYSQEFIVSLEVLYLINSPVNSNHQNYSNKYNYINNYKIDIKKIGKNWHLNLYKIS